MVAFHEEFQDFYKLDNTVPEPCEMFRVILKTLTPQSFLTDAVFDEKKDVFFQPGAEPNYPVDTLNDAGRAAVYKEFQRLSQVYRETYKNFLTPDEFLGLYVYTTNLGYKGINSQLRTGQGTQYSQMIALSHRGLEKLSRIPKFQYKAGSETERTELIRHMSLPPDVLAAIIEQAKKTGTFKDLAFLSTSTCHEGACAFKGNVAMHIMPRGKLLGAKLDGISPFPHEKELLVLPASKLKVQKIIETDTEHGRHVTLEIVAQNFSDVFHVRRNVLKFAGRWQSFHQVGEEGGIAAEKMIKTIEKVVEKVMEKVMEKVQEAKITVFRARGDMNQVAKHLRELAKEVKDAAVDVDVVLSEHESDVTPTQRSEAARVRRYSITAVKEVEKMASDIEDKVAKIEERSLRRFSSVTLKPQ